ncbi:MAG: precorrin-6y C5,15-methyltransferase (decarboxylating) subunit CbiE [Victivallales bacterium]
MKSKIAVIGCGVSPECITPHARGKVMQSDVLAGGKRLLDFFPEFKGQKIVLKSGILEVISELKKMSAGKRIAILASGDPLFHGIGSKLGSHFKDSEIEIMPNVSAMQSLFSKLRISWDNAALFTVHGGKKAPYRNILNSSKSVIYCDDKVTASGLAAKLVAKFPRCKERKAVIAENLGMSEEKISRGTLENLTGQKVGGLSILVLLPTEDIINSSIALGLDDHEFMHENRMITHSEVRAVALSKLRIGPGVMWDIGAASGSVGIEAASLCPDLNVIAVESDSKRFGQLQKNIDEFGLPNAKAIHAGALKTIADLPKARAIFIGGGGKDIKQIVEKAFRKLLPGGRLVVTAVLLETKAALTKCLENNFVEAVSISVSRSSVLGSSRLMKSENSVDIFVYEK